MKAKSSPCIYIYVVLSSEGSQVLKMNKVKQSSRNFEQTLKRATIYFNFNYNLIYTNRAILIQGGSIKKCLMLT